MAGQINFSNSEKLDIFHYWCKTHCSFINVANFFNISTSTAKSIIDKEYKKDTLKAELIRLSYWNHRYSIADSNRIAVIKRELKQLGVNIL